VNSIFLAMSSHLLRDAVRRLLTDGGFSIVGEAPTIADALPPLASNTAAPVDFFIAYKDIGDNSTEAFAHIRQLVGNKSRIVALAEETDIRQITRDYIMAVDGILTLSTSATEMIQSLRLIQVGERIVPSELVQSVFMPTPRLAPAAQRGPGQTLAVHPLTARETDILRQLVLGGSNKVIAHKLGITEATVKVHLKSLLRKLRASNRTQAAIWAQTHGFGDC